MEASGQLVEPDAVARVGPRGVVGLARRELELAGEQELPRAQERVARRHALCEEPVVARPGRVYPPDLAGPRGEAALAGDDEQRCVGARPAAARLAHVRAD